MGQRLSHLARAPGGISERNQPASSGPVGACRLGSCRFMSDPLRTLEDYELFLYTLSERFKSIRQSTIVLVRRGASLARVSGEIQFDHGFRLVVVERIVGGRSPVVIDAYGYEVWHESEIIFWYD